MNVQASLADVAHDEQPWGRLAWLFSGETAPGAQMTLGHVVIEPGRENPLHVHENAEEMLFLIEGTLEHRIGDQVLRVEPGGALRVAAGLAHNARSVGERPARMLVCYSDPRRHYASVPQL